MPDFPSFPDGAHTEFPISSAYVHSLSTLAHPIETVRGRYGGGVRVADGYYLGRKYLKPNQQELLKRLSENLTGEDLATMNSILSEFALTKRAEK